MAALKGVKTLDMFNGEITKVSYEGMEYERIEGEAKVGDLVRLTAEARHDVTPGGFYTVRGGRGGRVQITDDVNDPHHLDEEYYVPFRKKHTRLKFGDYAKVVCKSPSHKLEKGDLVSVLHDDRGIRPFYCKCLTGKNSGGFQWLAEYELVHATEAEVAAAKEAEAKRSIEAKWAKIGRKVDEYRKGDIVAYDDPAWFGNKGIGTVIKDTDQCCDPLVEAVTSAGVLMPYCLRVSKLTLITPVEARFDRS
ncbi:hypothetical protein [Bacillus safensis]|uniref:hypothetical protein n=1 Tax=Bacillus safensis TaxID=561879 RepID=UPI002FFEC9BC